LVACFGKTAVEEALVGAVPDEKTKGCDSDIASAFKRSGKKTYSTQNLTKEEIQYTP
jgi:hypothetical protein